MSVYSALALVLKGSGGKSQEELLAALKLDADGQDVDTLIRSVGESLQKIPEGDLKNTLVQANGMFVEGSMSVLPSFAESVKSIFKGHAQEVGYLNPLPYRLFLQVDFIHASEEARKTINEWVSASTERKITELYPQGSINETTRMVLANAIYFKG